MRLPLFSFFFAAIWAFGAMDAAEPRSGRHTGGIGSDGKISFVVNRSGSHLYGIRCHFTARNETYFPGDIRPEYYPVSFSSRTRRFPMHGRNSVFNALGNDPRTHNEFGVYGRLKRRGLFVGYVQVFKKLTLENFNQNTGQTETVKMVLFTGRVNYEVATRQSAAGPR